MKWFLIMALLLLTAAPTSAVLLNNASNPIVQRQPVVTSTSTGGNITYLNTSEIDPIWTANYTIVNKWFTNQSLPFYNWLSTFVYNYNTSSPFYTWLNGFNYNYNETEASMSYTNLVNNSLASWITNTFATLLNLNTASTNLQANISDVNSSLDTKINGLPINASFNETRTNTIYFNFTSGIPINGSFSGTLNLTCEEGYDTIRGIYYVGNTWGAVCTISSSGNASFNETRTNTLYFNFTDGVPFTNLTGTVSKNCLNGEYLEAVSVVEGVLDGTCQPLPSSMDYTNLFMLNQTNIATQNTTFQKVSKFLGDLFFYNKTMWWGNGSTIDTQQFVKAFWNYTATTNKGSLDINSNLQEDGMLLHDHAHGEMYLTPETIIPLANAWLVYPLDTQGWFDNVDFSPAPNYQLICNVSGIYKVDWSVTVHKSEFTVLNDIDFAVFVNGVQLPVSNSMCGLTIQAGDDTTRENCGGTAEFYCNYNDPIDLRYMSNIPVPGNILAKYGSLNIVRVGETT